MIEYIIFYSITQQQQNKMATITTVTPKPFKQYEFCDGIKAHILSYLGAKKMKFTDVAASKWKDRNYLTIRSQVYYMRMAISHEQMLWELTAAGKDAGLREVKRIRSERLPGGASKMMFYRHAQFNFAPYLEDSEQRLATTGNEKAVVLSYKKRLLEELRWGYNSVVVLGQLKREKEAQKAAEKRRRADSEKMRVDCNCGCGKNIAMSTYRTHRRKYEQIHAPALLGAPGYE